MRHVYRRVLGTAQSIPEPDVSEVGGPAGVHDIVLGVGFAV
jgi:hypothetical protein